MPTLKEVLKKAVPVVDDATRLATSPNCWVGESAVCLRARAAEQQPGLPTGAVTPDAVTQYLNGLRRADVETVGAVIPVWGVPDYRTVN